MDGSEPYTDFLETFARGIGASTAEAEFMLADAEVQIQAGYPTVVDVVDAGGRRTKPTALHKPRWPPSRRTPKPTWTAAGTGGGGVLQHF